MITTILFLIILVIFYSMPSEAIIISIYWKILKWILNSFHIHFVIQLRCFLLFRIFPSDVNDKYIYDQLSIMIINGSFKDNMTQIMLMSRMSIRCWIINYVPQFCSQKYSTKITVLLWRHFFYFTVWSCVRLFFYVFDIYIQISN